MHTVLCMNSLESAFLFLIFNVIFLSIGTTNHIPKGSAPLTGYHRYFSIMSHDTHILIIGFKLGGVKKYFSIIISTYVLVKVSDYSKGISTWRGNFEPDTVAQLPRLIQHGLILAFKSHLALIVIHN